MLSARNKEIYETDKTVCALGSSSSWRRQTSIKFHESIMMIVLDSQGVQKEEQIQIGQASDRK